MLNNYLQTFYIGLAFRIIIFIYLIFFPFYHSTFGFVSPFTYQWFADLAFYLDFGHKELCWGKSFNYECNEEIINIYNDIIKLNFENITNRYPGPLFPVILFITNYKINFPYLLSFFIFFTEIFAFFIWNKFFYTKINFFGALIFSLMPLPLYFGFFHSTDVIFYFLASLVYLISINFIKFKTNKFLIIILFLLAAIRPAGLPIVFFSLVLMYINKENFKSKLLLITILVLFTIYYLPYIIYEFQVLQPNQVDNNTFNFLNFLSYYILKFFKVLGFVKSDSGNLYFYLLRSCCGLIFCIGYFYSLLRGNLITLMYLNFILIPIILFFFPAYRYSLPVMPLLFMFSYVLFDKIFIKKLNLPSRI